MAFLKFNANNMGGMRSTKPEIRISRKSYCAVNKIAVDAIGLKKGDKIALFQDEDKPEDWYLAKDKDGFQLRETKNITSGLNFNSAALANAMLDALNLESAYAANFRLFTDAKEIEGGGESLSDLNYAA